MKINTKFFGEEDINENELITFESGLPGFENLKKFTLIEIEGKETLKCLQSVEDETICLLAVTPWEYFNNYEVTTSNEEMKPLKIFRANDLLLLKIINIHDDKITANLTAPVIINLSSKLAKQFVMPSKTYTLKESLH